MKTTAQDYHFKQEFMEKWQNSKAYTLKVARLMPGEHYNYQPSAHVRTFGQQMQHLAEAMIYHAGLAISLKAPKDQNPNAKTAIVNLIEASFDLVHEALIELDEKDFETKVKFWDGPTSRRKLLNFTLDHITHHRAQAIVLLRMNNIKPPNYIGW